MWPQSQPLYPANAYPTLLPQTASTLMPASTSSLSASLAFSQPSVNTAAASLLQQLLAVQQKKPTDASTEAEFYEEEETVSASTGVGGGGSKVNVAHNAIYNLNEILANNILSAEYFRNLGKKESLDEVIEEAYNEITHLAPYVLGRQRIASTAFCILYKLFMMKLTTKQVKTLLEYPDSPFIRGLGFLFLRYIALPQDLWTWFYPYLNDPEEFVPGGGGDQDEKNLRENNNVERD